MKFGGRMKRGRGKQGDRIRILFFDHTAVLSGGELALLNLVEHLDRERFDPVVVLGQTGPLVDSMKAIAETHVIELDPSVKNVRKDVIGWRTVVAPSKLFVSFEYVARLKRSFQSLGAEVVHTNSLKSDILGGIAARLAGIPLIWHVRDRIEEGYLPKKVALIFRKLCRIVPDRIITNSYSTLETMQLGKARPSYVIPSGFNVESFQDAGGKNDSLAEAVQGHRPIRIGIVGRISPWKGQEIFVQAAKQVHQEFPDAHFSIIGSVMFGEDEFEKSLHKLVHELQLEEIVTFAGFKKDVAAAIGELHILVHASTIPEPFGQVIAQGMAARKPVIATIGGGASEIVADGDTGFLIPPGNVPALAEALLKILRQPEHAALIAERAQKYAIETFAIARTARIVESVYLDILGVSQNSDETLSNKSNHVDDRKSETNRLATLE